MFGRPPRGAAPSLTEVYTTFLYDNLGAFPYGHLNLGINVVIFLYMPKKAEAYRMRHDFQCGCGGFRTKLI